MSRPALLDINILVALFDPDHVHHDLAHDWFADHRAFGWATCPLTENGLVRVLAHPAYGGDVTNARTLIEALRKFCASAHHQFWADDISLRDPHLFNPAYLVGPRQLTDVYLLGLAKKRSGRLATFDRSIPLKAVVKGDRALVAVIAPTDEV